MTVDSDAVIFFDFAHTASRGARYFCVRFYEKNSAYCCTHYFSGPFTHADGISEETLVARMDAIYGFCEKRDPVMKGLASTIAKKWKAQVGHYS